MMTNPRRGKTLSTNIPIYTLSGGVGRQAPSKRLPSEAQEMINALCTVERSVEKRPGTDLVPIWTDVNGTYTGDRLGLPAGGTYEFFWHALSDDARYLFVINRAATTDADNLYYTYYYNQTEDRFEDHTAASQTDSDIPADVRAYLTHGSAKLKLVTRGQNLVFLNPDVAAGYTSSYDSANTAWVTHNLDGTQKDGADSANHDTIGAEADYKTATNVDPEGIAQYWDPYSTYVAGTTLLYLDGTSANADAAKNSLTGPTTGDDVIFNCIQSTSIPDPSGTQDFSDTAFWSMIAYEGDGTDRAPTQISPKDWEYPNSTKYQLGQSLPTFNDLTIPPLKVDVTTGNNNAETMLSTLYPDLNSPPTDAGTPTDSADGKIFYIQTGYQGQAPGYYLASSVESPHFTKIRTPDAYSVLDAKRMPVQLEFVGGAVGSQWSWSLIDWAHRTSGDKETNPGPTPFKEGRQSKISSIAFYRNRLWMSAGDVVFSSRSDDFTDLWIEDPGTLVDTDPIDIAASTNTYTPITAMVPFKDYMFVNTNADVQYELMGSENQITPFTAELQPMTFYSTAPLVEPLTLGNYIFFFDAERLYLYMGRGGTLATAQELSSHCPKYLPSNYGATSVAAAQDTILAVDEDSSSDVYLYTTKYRGNEIAQNAFYQFSYEGADVRSMQSWDNDNYMVVSRDTGFFIERQHMRFQDTDIPLLDRKQKITLTFGTLSANRTSDNAEYSATAFTTTIRLPFLLESGKSYQLIDSEGVAYLVDDTSADVSSGLYTDITLQGDLRLQPFVWIGEKFTMQIQLSTQFVRDERNNAQEGVLNLASLRTSHFETGNYDVITQRRGRPVADIVTAYESRDYSLLNYTTTFAAPRADVAVGESNLPLLNTEYQGELVSKIMGYSDKVDIFILSDYFTPVNITNMELKGKFTQKYSSVL